MKPFNLLAVLIALQLLSLAALGQERIISAPEKTDEHKLVRFDVATKAKFVKVTVRRTIIINGQLFYSAEKGDVEESIPRKSAAKSFTFTGRPGTYQIIVETSDPELGLGGDDVPTEIVAVRPPTVPPTNPPTDPPTTPPSDYTALQAQARQLVLQLNDPVTTANLLMAYNQALPKILSAPDLVTAQNILVADTEAALQKTGRGRTADWLNGYRRPINQSINALNITTTAEYAKVVQALIRGLSAQS